MWKEEIQTGIKCEVLEKIIIYRTIEEEKILVLKRK